MIFGGDTGHGQPPPGSVFREHTFTHRFSECDPGSTTEFCLGREKMRPRELDLDLTDVVRAEVAVEYWGGHIGTSDQKFRVNGHPWHALPQPAGTPTSPFVYYRNVLGNGAVPVPVEQLRQGSNSFQFTCGPQIKYSFNWGYYIVYAFTVRAYLEGLAEAPTGRILWPRPGQVLGDDPSIEVEADGGGHAIERVDVIAHYEDFDWEGDGRYRQWHYQEIIGGWRRHVGGDDEAPYAVTWSTEWIPDQEPGSVQLMARVTNTAGVSTMTRVVDGLTLSRQPRSVRMYTAYEMPENFRSRARRRHSCKLFVPHDLSQARRARLALSTWSGLHAEEIGLNGVILTPSIGRIHAFSYDTLDVPLDIVRRGVNEFHTYSETSHHGIEVNWPGPALLIEYETPVADPPAATVDLAIFARELAEGWKWAVTQGELAADTELRLRPSALSRGRIEFLPGGIVMRAGYEAIALDYFAPDVAAPEEWTLYLNGNGVKLADVGPLPEGGAWNRVEVPLRRFPASPGIESVGFFARFAGQLQLRDVRLVAAAATAVSETPAATPAVSALSPSHPNPFNGETVIPYRLATDGMAELVLFDVLGQRIVGLVDGHRPAGPGAVRWDGRDADGRPVASGVYLARLQTSAGADMRRLLLLR